MSYIVYYPDYKIESVNDWMGKHIGDKLRGNKSLKCINTTNPKAKEILKEINKVNNTNHGNLH